MIIIGLLLLLRLMLQHNRNYIINYIKYNNKGCYTGMDTWYDHITTTKLTGQLSGIKKLKSSTSVLEAYVITDRNKLKNYIKYYDIKDDKVHGLSATRNTEDNIHLTQSPCIYFLMGRDEVYVGKTDRGGLIRIIEHDKSKSFWTNAVIIYHKDSIEEINGFIKKNLLWNNEPMAYYEEALFYELDKENYKISSDIESNNTYSVANKVEPSKALRESYLADKSTYSLNGRFIEDTAIYVDYCDCDAFQSFLINQKREELHDIEAKKSTRTSNEQKALEKAYQRECGYVPTYYTPEKYAFEMVSTIINNIWEEKQLQSNGNIQQAIELFKQTKILNIACKDKPEFLNYAFTIIDSILALHIKNSCKRAEHIHNQMLFGLCLRPDMRDNLREYFDGSFDDVHKNITWIPEYKYLVNLGNSQVEPTARKIINHFGGKIVKFDAVIGNPPYQNATTTIYQDFIDLGLKLSDKVCMIVKGNWMTSDTLKQTRNNMINAGIKEIVNYPIIHEVFDNADVLVNVFYIDREYKDKTIIREIQKGKETSKFNINLHGMTIIPLNEIEASIVRKISQFVTPENNFGKLHVLPCEPFRITSNGNVGRGTKAYMLDMQRTKTSDYDVAVAFMESDRSMSYMYTKRKFVPNRDEIIDDFKVLCGEKLNKNGTVISNIQAVVGPSVCSSSYCVIYSSKNKYEATKAYFYSKTKLFRYLVGLFCELGKTAVSSYRFSLVPEQDYSDDSDINWTNNLEDLDAQLYKKYGFSEEEINHIDTTMTY